MNVKIANQTTMLLFTRIAVIVMMMMASSCAGEPTLRQVQIVTRHGARTPLPKTALLQENNDPVLTPLGQLEHYNLGVWLRNRYSGLQVIDTYNDSLTDFNSSFYVRTLVSAQSLALGLFPNRGATLLPANVTPANIPVHALAAKHDITIRAYENCPAFKKNLNDLYETDTWTQYQADHLKLLQSLAQIPYFAPYANFGPYVLLSQVWNAYDAIQVSRTECGLDNTSEFCIKYSNPALANILSDADWSELKQVAQFAELTKYGIPTAKNLLGSNLLVNILNGMGVYDFTTETSMPAPALTFRMYSAHYPTILSLFAALNIVYKSLEGIPNYASALIFELWGDDASDANSFVRVLFKDGLSDTAQPVQLNNQCGGVFNCTLANFSAMIESISFATPADWCMACNNTLSDVCVANLLSVAESTASSTMCSSSNRDASTKGAIAGSFFGGMGAMALIVLIASFLFKK